jgi:hypothetical protein
MISRVMESTHMGAMCNSLQYEDETQLFLTIANMDWLRKRVIWKFENLRARNILLATDEEINEIAERTVADSFKS